MDIRPATHGGFVSDQPPPEIYTAADLPKIADALTAAGFNTTEVNAILGANWLRFFRQNLP
jgi:microsomal dipeptidase-like Zn-dependent dipeptidase